ncbi:hypothetical protein EYC84_001072 [Monilinia fructicola]|uniref:Uncharacterized protein n=1 Tax=Monilinia fructicola TaxID=38448 RepID=A0A5M9JNV1_MONFR|nr:hypothetical protein EYC84_001072 [Monilinia fructicola]
MVRIYSTLYASMSLTLPRYNLEKMVSLSSFEPFPISLDGIRSPSRIFFLVYLSTPLSLIEHKILGIFILCLCSIDEKRRAQPQFPSEAFLAYDATWDLLRACIDPWPAEGKYRVMPRPAGPSRLPRPLVEPSSRLSSPRPVSARECDTPFGCAPQPHQINRRNTTPHLDPNPPHSLPPSLVPSIHPPIHPRPKLPPPHSTSPFHKRVSICISLVTLTPPLSFPYVLPRVLPHPDEMRCNPTPHHTTPPPNAEPRAPRCKMGEVGVEMYVWWEGGVWGVGVGVGDGDDNDDDNNDSREVIEIDILLV